MATLAPSSSASLSKDSFSTEKTTTFSDCKGGKGGTQQTQLRILGSFKTRPGIKLKALMETPRLVEELKSELESLVQMESGSDLFDEIKHRFLSFKRQKYMENLEHYQNLAKCQAPKTLGYAPQTSWDLNQERHSWCVMLQTWCLHLRVDPQMKAALEFAVNSLEVENILVIGHSCCGGICALMSMQDGEDSSGFIGRWVVVGRKARLNTEVAASNLGFDQQCRHCEKESVNCSLLNLLTYPWVEEKVRKGLLSVHGGYYDFVECTFEK